MTNRRGLSRVAVSTALAVVVIVLSRLRTKQTDGSTGGESLYRKSPRTPLPQPVHHTPQPALSPAPQPPSAPSVATTQRRLSRTGRINLLAGALMLALTTVLALAAWVFWPDTSGPPPGVPTIGGFGFSVDTPNVDGAVRILVNPDAKVYTGGPPGLMDVAVDLDVPAGQTVRWTLDLGAVSSEIRLDKLPDAPNRASAWQKSGTLIEAPGSYELPPPINRVRDYVLTGEVKGPSSAYTQLAARNFIPAANSDTSLTGLAWSGPLPTVFRGAYVTVSIPALTAAETQTTPASGFDFGWTPVSLRKFHAVEELALPGDYQIGSGSQTSGGFRGWAWSADGSTGIVNATGIGSSLTKQAEIQRLSFAVGIMLGVAASAFFGGLQNLVVTLSEWKR